MKRIFIFLLTCLSFLKITHAANDICQDLYVWEFADENNKRNNISKMITNEVEDALTATACKILQRRNYARLAEQVNSEKAIQSLENVNSKLNSQLKLINARVVLFGQVSQDFSGNLFVRVSFESLQSKQILLSSSVTLAGEEAHNIAKRKQKIQSFIMNCVGEKVISGDETHFWQQTKILNTVEAYETYLGKYPGGKYVTEAKEILKEEAAWAQIPLAKNNKKKIKALEAYIDNNQTQHLDEANDLLEDLLWTSKKFYRYIFRYPEGKYITEDNVWNHYGYEKYLELYPNGKYATEENLWATNIKLYLERYPNGKYATEDNIWEKASVEFYLNKFPRGKYRFEAEKVYASAISKAEKSTFDLERAMGSYLEYFGSKEFKLGDDALWGLVMAKAYSVGGLGVTDEKLRFKNYLKYFPNGRHTNEAKKALGIPVSTTSKTSQPKPSYQKTSTKKSSSYQFRTKK